MGENAGVNGTQIPSFLFYGLDHWLPSLPLICSLPRKFSYCSISVTSVSRTVRSFHERHQDLDPCSLLKASIWISKFKLQVANFLLAI